jgi:hypothetical protein
MFLIGGYVFESTRKSSEQVPSKESEDEIKKLKAQLKEAEIKLSVYEKVHR